MKRLILILIGLLVCGSVLASPSEVLWYKCNDDAANTTVTNDGTGSNGTLAGGDNTSVKSEVGQINDAFHLNGSDDYIDAESAYNATISADHTVSFWMKPDDGQPAASNYVMGWQDKTNNDWYFIYLETDGGMRMVVDENTTVIQGRTTSAVFANGASSWTHIAFVYDWTTDTFTCYVNGSSVAWTWVSGTGLADITNANLASSFDLFVGARNDSVDGAELFYDGLLDDIRMFNDNLTSTQVGLIYNSGSGTESSLATLETEETYGDDANAVLLLHCDGTDASTTFTDDSDGGADSPHTVSQGGNAEIDTAQQAFGTASILFQGTDDYVYSADSNDWDFGAGDFTVDFRLRFNAFPTSGQYVTFTCQWDSEGHNAWWCGAYNSSGTIILYFFYTTDGTTAKTFSGTTSIATSTWYHVAYCRDGANFRMFVDGTQVGSTGNISTDTLYSSGLTWSAGCDVGTNYQYDLNGWLDEIRVSKGIARYTSNFTPKTSAYSETPAGSRRRMIICS